MTVSCFAGLARGGYPPDAHRRSDVPHPAVARIVVPENGATSFGSGVLIDVRDDFGLVVTNWHVVRDATGAVEVMLPGGFTSKARALKVDSDWDLAALVIWRPPAEPVPLATRAPQPGDQLTICGYGPGIYRAATGRCTQYYAPRVDLPQHMVELDVEARQGDSGGPIFNERGELAGVLFGAGQGTTLGSFGGRVGDFLASLAPDIGRGGVEPGATAPQFALAGTTQRAADDAPSDAVLESTATWRTAAATADTRGAQGSAAVPAADSVVAAAPPAWTTAAAAAEAPVPTESNSAAPTAASRSRLLDTVKTVLAAVGVVAIAAQLLKLAR